MLYIGETKRLLVVRLGKHLRDVKNSNKDASKPVSILPKTRLSLLLHFYSLNIVFCKVLIWSLVMKTLFF